MCRPDPVPARGAVRGHAAGGPASGRRRVSRSRAAGFRRGRPPGTPGVEEVATMDPMFRPCEDCGGETLFQQPHEAPGSCPDSPDGRCPEWCCTECGAALLTMILPPLAEAGTLADVAGRVA